MTMMLSRAAWCDVTFDDRSLPLVPVRPVARWVRSADGVLRWNWSSPSGSSHVLPLAIL